MAMHGGSTPNFSPRWTMQSWYLRRHTLDVLPSSYLTSHQHMHHLAQMHFVHLIWIRAMGGNNENKKILLFQWITCTLSSMGCPRRWQLKQVRQRASNRLLRNVVSRYRGCKWSVPLSAHLRTITVAWLVFSANRMISNSKNHFSSKRSRLRAIFAYSFPSFTASLIPLKWFVYFIHSFIFLYLMSTVLGLVQTQVPGNSQNNIWRSKESCTRVPWWVPSWGHPAIL